MEHEIPFTQYMLPHGRPVPVTLPVDEETYRKAQQILDRGLKFEVEMLQDYSTVSATITDPEEGDLAFAICPNGPEVPERIKAMILEFPLP